MNSGRVRPGRAGPGRVRPHYVRAGRPGGGNAGGPGLVRDGHGRVAVQVIGFRAAEAIRVPAVRVIAEVVIDGPAIASCVLAAAGRRAAVLDSARGPRIAIPNVKVISFAAHASSLVARRSRLTGMRPLPGKRARPSLEPAENKRYLLDLVFTGWSAHAASGVRQVRQCRERKRKRGGSTRNSDRPRPRRPGIPRIR